MIKSSKTQCFNLISSYMNCKIFDKHEQYLKDFLSFQCSVSRYRYNMTVMRRKWKRRPKLMYVMLLLSFSLSSDNRFLGISLWMLRGKIWNFHRILYLLVLTRNIKIIRWCAAVAKNQLIHVITYDRKFSIVKSGSLKYMNFQKGIKLDFNCMKMKLTKNKKYLQQKFSWKVHVWETTTDFTFRVSKIYVPFTCKFPMVMHLVLILNKHTGSKTNFHVFSYDKTSLKFCERFRFFLAVFTEKF